MMNILQMMARNAAQNGYKKGQSAAEFAASNPNGAKRTAEFIKANMPAIVGAVSNRLNKGA